MSTPLLTAVLLFFLMVIAAEAGFLIGRRRYTNFPEGSHVGVGAIEGAVLALLGLILAFTFSGASSRLITRRQLIVQEANAIGTAYLRIDLLRAEDQAQVRQLFQRYLVARLAVYERLSDKDATSRALQNAERIQNEIWKSVTASTQGQQNSLLVLPAVNEMIDVTTARTLALRTHTPKLIITLMLGLAILSSMMAGYGMGETRVRNVLLVVLFSLAISVTVYVVLDLDNPNSGLIRLSAAEEMLMQLKDTMR